MRSIELSEALSVADRLVADTTKPFEGRLAPKGTYDELTRWHGELVLEASRRDRADRLALHLLAADIRGYELVWPVAITGKPLRATLRSAGRGTIPVEIAFDDTTSPLSSKSLDVSGGGILLYLDIEGKFSDTSALSTSAHIQSTRDLVAAMAAEVLWDVQLSRAETMMALPAVKQQYLAALRDIFEIPFDEVVGMYQRSRQLREGSRLTPPGR